MRGEERGPSLICLLYIRNRALGFYKQYMCVIIIIITIQLVCYKCIMDLLSFVLFNFLALTSKFGTSFTQLKMKIERLKLLYVNYTVSETGDHMCRWKYFY